MLCVLATILKIAAKMATIMAAIATIFKWHLSNFELKLEIPNIMLVCKFEINCSTNKNLRAFTTYLGWMDGCQAFQYPSMTPAQLTITPT